MCFYKSLNWLDLQTSTKISSYNQSYVKVIIYPRRHPLPPPKKGVHSKISQLHDFSVISKYKENLLIHLDINATQTDIRVLQNQLNQTAFWDRASL